MWPQHWELVSSPPWAWHFQFLLVLFQIGVQVNDERFPYSNVPSNSHCRMSQPVCIHSFPPEAPLLKDILESTSHLKIQVLFLAPSFPSFSFSYVLRPATLVSTCPADNIIAGKRKCKELLKETIQAKRQPEINSTQNSPCEVAITSQWTSTNRFSCISNQVSFGSRKANSHSISPGESIVFPTARRFCAKI